MSETPEFTPANVPAAEAQQTKQPESRVETVEARSDSFEAWAEMQAAAPLAQATVTQIEPLLERQSEPLLETKSEPLIEMHREPLLLETKSEPLLETQPEPLAKTDSELWADKRNESRLVELEEQEEQEKQIETVIEKQPEPRAEVQIEPQTETPDGMFFKTDETQVETHLEPQIEPKVDTRPERRAEPRLETWVDTSVQTPIETPVEASKQLPAEAPKEMQIELQSVAPVEKPEERPEEKPAETRAATRPEPQALTGNDRPFRVKLRGSVLVLIRLPNKRQLRAALHQLSTSGGVINLEKPLDEKIEVELIFHIDRSTIRGKAQMLFPMWATQGWMQPFRFVELADADRNALHENLQSFIGNLAKGASAAG